MNFDVIFAAFAVKVTEVEFARHTRRPVNLYGALTKNRAAFVSRRVNKFASTFPRRPKVKSSLRLNILGARRFADFASRQNRDYVFVIGAGGLLQFGNGLSDGHSAKQTLKARSNAKITQNASCAPAAKIIAVQAQNVAFDLSETDAIEQIRLDNGAMLFRRKIFVFATSVVALQNRYIHVITPQQNIAARVKIFNATFTCRRRVEFFCI